MIPPQIVYVVDRLKLARAVSGLTIPAMNISGTPGYWSNFENLRAEPRISTVAKYADSLGLSLSMLFNGCPNSAGEIGFSESEALAAGKKLFGKSYQSVGISELWGLVCLSGVNGEWKEKCQQWIEKRVTPVEKEPSRTWWCVTVSETVYAFEDKAEADGFAKKGSSKTEKVTDFAKWSKKLQQSTRVQTKKGVFSLAKFASMA